MERADGRLFARAGRPTFVGVRLAHSFAVVLLVGGCAHQAQVVTAGRSERPYNGLPYYLVEAPPAPPPQGGVYEERVPVAGRAWQPGRDLLDEIRLRLARVDTAVVSLRGQAGASGTSERKNVAGGS